MNEMALIVPSRGRPENIQRLYDALVKTDSKVDLYIGVDMDDPKLEDYLKLKIGTDIVVVVSPERKRFGPTLNDIAMLVHKQYKYLAWMGDDHLPITPQWDQKYRDVLDRHQMAMVYGNDLVQGERIATQLAFTSKAVEILGYAVPSGFTHLFIDNYFMELFKKFDAMHYLPDVIVQHLHYSAGQSEQDQTYKEANSQENWTNDKIRFEEYIRNELERDASKLIDAI